MAKKKLRSKTATKRVVIENVPEFTVHVPQGTEKLTLHKATVSRLLQAHCNLTIEDFQVVTDGDKEKFELLFAPGVEFSEV